MQHQGLSAQGVALRYGWNGDRSSHRASIGFSKSKIQSGPSYDFTTWPDGDTFSTEPNYTTHVQLLYAYLHKVPVPGAVTLRLGGAVDVDLQSITWLYGPYGFGSYMGAFSLDLKTEFTVPVAKRHSLTLDVGVPLLAWVARSPYSIHSEETIYANRDDKPAKTLFRYIGNGRAESWNSFRAFRASLGYRWQITDPVGLAVTVHTRLMGEVHPRPLFATETGLTVAANIQF